jgi:Spy/CpxP family protein refolding chaperone
MKPNELIIGSIFATALTAFGATAYAAPGNDLQCTGFGGTATHHTMRDRQRGATPPHFRQLGLSEAQRNQIFDIKYKSMPTMRQHYQQMRATRIALREASTGTNYDAAKVRTLADKLGKLQADIATLRAADQHKIYAVLTPQQQSQLQKMRNLRPAYGTMRGFVPGVPPMDTGS